MWNHRIRRAPESEAAPHSRPRAPRVPGRTSAGLALLEDGGLDYLRLSGISRNLKQVAKHNGSQSSTGLGHTRWATHGRVSEMNAHPLAGCDERKAAVVLNGIVENFRELKHSLEADGHKFNSETDAEVVLHLASGITKATSSKPSEPRTGARGPLRLRRRAQRPSEPA